MRPVLLAVALAFALAVGALAQVPAPAVEVALAEGPREVAAGNSTTLVATVRNAGSLAGSVTVAVAPPAGWQARAEPGSFDLPAGGSREVRLVVAAPPAGEGAAAGRVELAARLVEQGTGRAAAAEAGVALARLDPPPPAAVEPQGIGVAAVGGGIALVAVGGAGAVAFARGRRRSRDRAAWLAREAGLALERVDGPAKFGSRREEAHRFAVTNVAATARVALLRVAERPEGWVVGLSAARLALEPGDRSTVTLYVGPGDEVEPGAEGSVVVAARVEGATEHEERLALPIVASAVRSPNGHGPSVRPRGIPPILRE